MDIPKSVPSFSSLTLAMVIIAFSVLFFLVSPSRFMSVISKLLFWKRRGQAKGKSCLPPHLRFRSYSLAEKTRLGKSSAYQLIFQKADGTDLDVPIGHHVAIRVSGKTRFYTPLRAPTDGTIRLVVRERALHHSSISHKLCQLNVGDRVEISGPRGKFDVKKEVSAPVLGLIAGGTGITPFIRVLDSVLNAKKEHSVYLIYANRTALEAAVLRSVIDEYQKEYKDVFTVVFTEKRNIGRADIKDMEEWMKKHGMEQDASNAKFLVCGPPRMVVETRSLLDVAGLCGKDDVGTF
jgi:cytochrome-b5 reductase